jgi:hypothetical protein
MATGVKCKTHCEELAEAFEAVAEAKQRKKEAQAAPAAKVASAERNPIQFGQYYETQDGHGCGRHALNNFFGHKIFKKEGDNLTKEIFENLGANVVNADNTVNTNIIALQPLCRYISKIKLIGTGPEKFECPDNENYEAVVLQVALAVLGYSGDTVSKLKEWLEEETDDGDVIGYIVNFKNPGHWVAYRKLKNGNYKYINSIKGVEKNNAEIPLSELKGLHKDKIEQVLEIKFEGIVTDIKQTNSTLEVGKYKTGDTVNYKPNNKPESGEYVVVDLIRNNEQKLIGYWLIENTEITKENKDMLGQSNFYNNFTKNSGNLLKGEENKNIPQSLINDTGTRDWYYATPDRISDITKGGLRKKVTKKRTTRKIRRHKKNKRSRRH